MEEKRTEHRLESKWQALIMTGIVLAAALLFLYSFLGGKKKETQPITRSDFALDTFITVTLYDTEDTAVLDGCMELCRDYEKLFRLDRTIDDIRDCFGMDAVKRAVFLGRAIDHMSGG